MKSKYLQIVSTIASLLYLVPAAHSQSDFEAYRKTILAQWEELRADPAGKKGTNVRWAFKVREVDKPEVDSGGGFQLITGELNARGQHSKDVVAIVRSRSEGPKAQPVKVDDWVIAEGKFESVNPNGVIVLSSVRLTNQGYRGSGDSPK